MVRTIVVLVVNLAMALIMAASVTPVAIIAAPVIRSTPAAGYAFVAAAVFVFAGVNLVLWQWWKAGSQNRRS